MRPLELLLFALTLAALAAGWFPRLLPRSFPARHALIAIALAAALAQATVEGARWQLWGLYLLLALLLYRAWRPQLGRESVLPLGFAAEDAAAPTGGMRRRFAAWAEGGFGGMLAVSSLGLAIVLPVPSLPDPGPEPIGTATYHWTDADRKATYGPTPDAPRALMVQVWYPAATAQGERQPWLPEFEQFVRPLANNRQVPMLTFHHLRLVRSHAYPNAPIAASPDAFPVILYSHGWTGFRQVALNEIERLAAHGYVVVAPDHTYGALTTIFPDGTTIPYDPAAMPPRSQPDELRQPGIERLVDTYTGDLRFALDQLERLNTGEIASPLKGRLDLTRVGIFGHSTGGGATVELALTDARVTAAAALDPWVEPVTPSLRATPLPIPFLSIRCSDWALDPKSKNNPIVSVIRQNAAAPFYDYYLRDTTHYDFTLMPLLSPALAWFDITGPLESRRALEVVDAALLAFFDQELRGDADALAARLKQAPELIALRAKGGKPL